MIDLSYKANLFPSSSSTLQEYVIFVLIKTNKMRIFFSLFILLALVGCDSSSPKLEASIDDVKNGTNVYLTQLGPENIPIPLDTTQVQNNSFEFDLKKSNQDINLIQIEGVNGNMIFINDANQIKIEADKSNLRNSKIEAGEHNQLLKDYLDMITSYAEERDFIKNEHQQALQTKDEIAVLDYRLDIEAIEEESKEATLEFIKTNTHSIVGMMALSDVMNSKSIPLNQMKSIYEEYDGEVKDTPLGRAMGQNIAKIGATDLGAEAPKFSGPTPDGDNLSLDDAKGKVTLIDFWASWCRPCRVENPNIVSIYNDYKDKGFTVVGVSLDKPNRKDAWLKAIEDDNLDWNHISNLKHWQEPIAQKYGVRAIPAAFLIDENGIIIGKDLRGNDLREKVREVLGN
ncbi:TlpA disulfide reductase family protein [Psychroflexus montanilacus]|uniref:TlpA disulfide reductase family protein n=1 Tax=Psychroflexus montanilacus TaxID=2873598 RepID=UPI001CCEAD29|nr:TlpA disulfide reductase family protein [Psychroflexus montanilacus]MBZ9652958.1 AhpC/TSA family protein [Psychroflexus montanilacus]